MIALTWLMPAALFLGLLALAGFLWTLRSGQYDDLDGDSERILAAEDRPLPARPRRSREDLR